MYLEECEKSVGDCKGSACIDVGKSTVAGDESLGEDCEKESGEKRAFPATYSLNL